MGIEGVGGQTQTQQAYQTMGTPTDVELQAAVNEVAPLLGGLDTNLNVMETRSSDKTRSKSDLSDVPVLDEADAARLGADPVDLEALLAYLQADSDEAQLKASKDRIESLQGQLSAAHQNSMDKINESIEAMKEQEKSAKLSQVMGWLGVVLAVAMAVVSVLTCGAGAAVCACIGAALAVTMQVLNETGAMEDIVKAVADFVQDCAVFFTGSEVSSAEADAIAEIIIAAIEIAIAIVCTVCSCGAGGGGALKNISEATAKAIKTACAVTGAAFTCAGIGSSVYSTVANYDATMSQADVTEMQGILKKLQTMLDEESEDLQQLIQQLMNSLSAVTDLLASKQDALNEISMNIGA